MPLLLALDGTTGWRAARLGYVAGAVSALGLLYWTSFVVVQYGGLPLPVGITVMVALCLAFALFPALFGWAQGRVCRSFGTAGLLAAPFLWVSTELLRVHTFFEFPWCLLGYSQYRNLPVIQVASVGGVYGVSFIVASSSALLAFATRAKEGSRRRAAFFALIGIVGGAWAGGAWVMRRPLEESGRVRVGLVQGGIRQDEKWDKDAGWKHVLVHLDLTDQAAARDARLVVWPESAVPFLYDENPAFAQTLRWTAQRLGIYLFFGNDDREVSGGEERDLVGAKMIDPTGNVVLRYHKIHLVPFGEYVPLQPIFTFGGRFGAKLVRQVSDFVPGTKAVVGPVDGHLVGGYICYEAIFPGLARRFAAAGAELLVNVTNDAWYGTTSAPHQHLAMAALRAVENRRYMVRAANTGITAVVDPFGRILAPTTLFDRTVLVRDVAFISGKSFYTRHGDLLARGCAAIALAFLAATIRRRLP